MRRVGASVLANALYLGGTVALTLALYAGWSLATTLVSHFVPLDRTYGTYADETNAEESRLVVWLWVAASVAALAGWSFVRLRAAPNAKRPRVVVLACLCIPAAIALAAVSALGAGPLASIALLFVLCDAVAFALVRAVDAFGLRALGATRRAIAGAVSLAAIVGLGAAYDTHSPDTAARARDREKSSYVRYAGTHYARYPNSPWTAKPPQTTEAEMQPLHLRYRQIDANHYRLCTTFETAVSTDARFPHGVGPACYTLSFDDPY